MAQVKDTEDTKHSSTENHELLLSLGSQLRSFDGNLKDYIVSSESKFTSINARIDLVQDSFRKMVDELKDTLASRGRMSSGFIFSLIAVLVSGIALVGGTMTSYINVRLGNVMPLIEANTAGINAAEAQRIEMRSELHTFEKEAIRAEAKAEESRRWIEKGLDIHNTEITELKRK